MNRWQTIGADRVSAFGIIYEKMETFADPYREKSRASFDRQARRYDVSRDGEHARTIYPHVLDRLTTFPHQSILDVGCRTGEVLSRLAERDGLSLAGVDLSPEMIGVARQKLGDRADLRVGDAEELPWPNGSFDVVLCLDSFHHYPSPFAALAEMWRVISEGGRLIVADFWKPAPMRQLINLFIGFSKDGDVRIYSEPEIRRLLWQSGFEQIRWEQVNDSAYVVTALR
jgi:ubiquinone/menaquinone biosynthesis C-methylase UbiE